jgi:hypothetical protein
VAELHGIHSRKRECVGVDVPPAVVAYPTGSTLALGYDTRGGDTEAGKVLNGQIWKDNPLSFINHVNEFFIEEG